MQDTLHTIISPRPLTLHTTISPDVAVYNPPIEEGATYRLVSGFTASNLLENSSPYIQGHEQEKGHEKEKNQTKEQQKQKQKKALEELQVAQLKTLFLWLFVILFIFIVFYILMRTRTIPKIQRWFKR